MKLSSGGKDLSERQNCIDHQINDALCHLKMA